MKVFVSGFSDLLHPAFSDDFIRRAFDVMVECPRVDFTVLTKRAERLAALAPTLPWPDNIIVGVTVESDAQSERVDHLRKVPARRRLISWEPALGSLEKTSLEGIHWVIAGCEKVGCWPKRPMDIEWVRDLRDRCQAEGIAFYFKQAAVGRKVVQHPELDGVVWEEFPE
jgi:protein gp37